MSLSTSLNRQPENDLTLGNSVPLHLNPGIKESLQNKQGRAGDLSGQFQSWFEGTSSVLLISVESWHADVLLARYLDKRLLRFQRPKTKIFTFLFGFSGNTRPGTNETVNEYHAETTETSYEDPLLEHLKAGESLTLEMAALRETINIAFQYSKAEDALCFLHGLHKCEASSRQALVRKLELCVTKQHNKGSLKFLVTTEWNMDILALWNNFGPSCTHFLWYKMAVETNLREYFVAVVDEVLNALNAQGNHDRIRKALDLDQSSISWTDVVLDVLGELSGDSFGVKQWRQLIDTSPAGSLANFKKLLEPATTSRQRTPNLCLDSQDYSSYPTVKKLLSIHLRHLLGAQAKPRRGKFEWARKPEQLSKSSICSDDGPSLAVVGRKLYAVWRGHSPNPYLWWSRVESMKARWHDPRNIPNAMTTSRPSVAARENTLVVMWKGLFNDETLWYSILNCDTGEWKGPIQTDFGSKAAPALSLWETESGEAQSKVWAVWRGTEGDELFWRASFNGERWGTQNPDYIYINTNIRPALASSRGRLYLAWTSSAPDSLEQIMVSFLDADADLWESPFTIESHCHSSAAPSLAKFKDTVYVAWRGKGNDLGIWLTPFARPGEPGFERPQRLGDCATDCTPALAEWEDKLILVWKGGWGNDCTLWWGWGDFVKQPLPCLAE